MECTNATYYYEDTGYMTPWPVVRYRIRLKRASSYYVPGYVALPILLTVRLTLTLTPTLTPTLALTPSMDGAPVRHDSTAHH